MNAKKIAQLLELVKYFTFKKGLPPKGNRIIFKANANVSKTEEIEDKYIELSGNYSFNIESLVIDYGAEYSSSLKSKEIKIYFGKYPKIGSIIGSGPDRKYDIIDDVAGLMTPAIVQDYVKNGKSFKRYLFPSDQDDTYSFDYKTFDEWYQTTLKGVDENHSRTRSMTILVEDSTSSYFDDFLNESLSDWRSRFTTAKDLAKTGDFYWFSLYDARIYEYELSFEDRMDILNYMVYSLSWAFIKDGIDGLNNVDEYELFISLINNTSKEDGAAFYIYMFEIDSSTQKTNLEVYKEKLKFASKLYDVLLRTLMKYFYSAKSITELKDDFSENRLYPIGYYQAGSNSEIYTYYNSDINSYNGTGILKIGAKYNVESNDKITIEATNYQFNLFRSGIRNSGTVDFNKFLFIGQSEKLNFEDIIYITPYFNIKTFNGLDIPYGCVVPIPAFALGWVVNENEEIKGIKDLIDEYITSAGVIFPFFQIVEGVSVLYNCIGFGLTLIGNALNQGLKQQIEEYDVSKSTPGHPYTKGKDFLTVYYSISLIYGGVNLKKAIFETKNLKDKIRVLFEYDNILTAWSEIGDFNTFMSLQYPNEINTINQEMNQLQIDYNKFK